MVLLLKSIVSKPNYAFSVICHQPRGLDPMLYKAISSLEKFSPLPTVDAHCDIPCKIYDPSMILIPALSVVRMIDIILETAEKSGSDSVQGQNTIARCVAMKELEATKVKEETRVIWGDYFKAPQFAAYPNIHDLAHSIMLKAGACKQNVARETGEELVGLVNEFAEIFWATKSVETTRKTCPYPPALAVVYPVL